MVDVAGNGKLLVVAVVVVVVAVVPSVRKALGEY